MYMYIAEGVLNEIHLMTRFLESASLSSNIGMPQPAPQREDLKKGKQGVGVLERRKDNYSYIL
jgi:hypothetical protein